MNSAHMEFSERKSGEEGQKNSGIGLRRGRAGGSEEKGRDIGKEREERIGTCVCVPVCEMVPRPLRVCCSRRRNLLWPQLPLTRHLKFKKFKNFRHAIISSSMVCDKSKIQERKYLN